MSFSNNVRVVCLFVSFWMLLLNRRMSWGVARVQPLRLAVDLFLWVLRCLCWGMGWVVFVETG